MKSANPTSNGFGNIYERQARSALIKSSTYSEGDAPRRTWISRFEYANGLVVEHDGGSWSVVTPETEAPPQRAFRIAPTLWGVDYSATAA